MSDIARLHYVIRSLASPLGRFAASLPYSSHIVIKYRISSMIQGSLCTAVFQDVAGGSQPFRFEAFHLTRQTELMLKCPAVGD